MQKQMKLYITGKIKACFNYTKRITNGHNIIKIVTFLSYLDLAPYLL